VCPSKAYGRPSCSPGVTTELAASRRVNPIFRARLERLSPIWFGDPASTFTPCDAGPRGLQHPRAPTVRPALLSLVTLVSRSEFDSNAPAGLRTPLQAAAHLLQHTSHGLCLPLDDVSAGSDLHRGYLPRLCCTLRVSHPLDALIPPVTFRPCCMPVPSTGFLAFRGFPPPVAGLASPPHLPSVPFTVRRLRLALARLRHRPLRLRGFTHPVDPCHRRRCYPAARWSILS
jgi:hypothetical protein